MAAQSGAPRRRDPERRRREIVAAAAELVIEVGPPALTHRLVAARAGVPLGSTTQYFASIDELREAALQQLADEIDASLAALEPLITETGEVSEHVVAEAVAFLGDSRAVRADIALVTMGTTDERLRPLALRWTDRLIDMLSRHIGSERATAIAVYLDGAMVHAGLHDAPLSEAELTRVVRALANMPAPGSHTAAKSLAPPPAAAAPRDPQSPDKTDNPSNTKEGR